VVFSVLVLLQEWEIVQHRRTSKVSEVGVMTARGHATTVSGCATSGGVIPMNFDPTAFKAMSAVVLTLCWAFSAAAQDRPQNKNEGTKSFGQGEIPEKLAANIQAKFANCPAAELDRLVASSDTTLAMAAAWERVRRTMSTANPAARAAAYSDAVSRFLGFVEGRIQVPIPELWREWIKKDGRFSQEQEKKVFAGIPDEVMKPKREADRWVVKVHGETIKLLKEEKPDGRALVGYAAVQLEGEKGYAAVYTLASYPYNLWALDRKTSKVIWSSEVWATGGMRITQLGWQFVQICLTPDTVAVFGISDTAAYLECFDKQTGKDRSRFCTAYFDEPMPAK